MPTDLASWVPSALTPVLHRAAYQALDLQGWHYDKIKCDQLNHETTGTTVARFIKKALVA